MLPGANGQPHVRKGPGGARLYRVEAVHSRPLPSLGQRAQAALKQAGQRSMDKHARHGQSVLAADASMSRANLLVFGRPSTPELARRPPTRMMGATRQALQAKDRALLAGFDATPSLLGDLQATAQGEYGRKRAGEPWL